jgi:hypothetical protein
MSEVDPRDFLRAVYLDEKLPLSVRMRAAIELMPYSYPKLAVVAQVTEQGFAELLDRRLKKLKAMEKNGSKAIAIDGPKPEIVAKPPLPRISDRRYRRM